MRLLLLLLLATPALAAPNPAPSKPVAEAAEQAKTKGKTKAKKGKKGKKGKASKAKGRAKATESAPLLALARHLDAGVRAWLSGRTMEAAMQPWRVETRSDLDGERSKLQQLGVERLELIPLEVNLTVAAADGTQYDVRVVTFADRDRWGLLELRSFETPGPSGLPFPEAATADALAEAAREVAQRLTSNDCGTTWVPDPLAYWPGAPFVDRAAKETTKLRDGLPELCAALTGGTATHFRWDDFGFLARGPEDSYAAFLEGELERDDGVTIAQFKEVMEMPDAQPPRPPEPVDVAELKPAPAEAFATPEDTWTTLLVAVIARDLATFADCFAPESRQREGMVDELAVNETLWTELDGILRAPQTIACEPNGDVARCEVEAPNADEGGIGGLTMVRLPEGWKIRSW